MLLLVIGVAGLAGVEAVVRHRYPRATRGAGLAALESWRPSDRRPEAEFHHTGDGIFRLAFPEERTGAPRIMIVGDSFAMGHGVGAEGRFGARVAETLGGGVAVDVLAASSYSPVIYRNIVRRGLSQADYAAVAVFVDQTDPVDDLIYESELIPGDRQGFFDVARMAERRALVDTTLDRLEAQFRGWRGVVRRSAIFNLLRPVSLVDSIPPESPYRDYIRLSLHRYELARSFQNQPGTELTTAMETLLLRHLDQLVGLCRRRGAAVLLAANPWEYQLGDGNGDNRLERLLQERYGEDPGVTVLPLTRAFALYPDPAVLFLPGNDIHWSEAGHALVAEQVIPALAGLAR